MSAFEIRHRQSSCGPFEVHDFSYLPAPSPEHAKFVQYSIATVGNRRLVAKVGLLGSWVDGLHAALRLRYTSARQLTAAVAMLALAMVDLCVCGNNDISKAKLGLGLIPVAV